ncbi:Uncharacterised protein [Mycobacterium tuberculosis]|nr:Uncharacterised protein [Mycobacterium tuberculosis]
MASSVLVKPDWRGIAPFWNRDSSNSACTNITTALALSALALAKLALIHATFALSRAKNSFTLSRSCASKPLFEPGTCAVKNITPFFAKRVFST